MSTPLKPCPFCGEEPLLKAQVVAGDPDDGWAVYAVCCDPGLSCGNRGPRRSIEELAFEAWNKREEQ